MAQRRGNLDRFAPVKGLITEASESNFPQDAAYDIDNMNINKTGLTERRLGLDVEAEAIPVLPNFTLNDKEKGIFSTYKWKTIANGVEVILRVLQYGSTIRIIEDTTPLSNGFEYVDIDLTDSGYSIGRDINSVCQYASSAGFLLICNTDSNPVVVENEGVTGETLVLTPSPLDLMIRTRELLEDTDVPITGDLTPEREFNLRNAGWPDTATNALNQSGTEIETGDPLVHYEEIRGSWPVNSVLYNAMKLSTAAEVVGVGSFSAWEDLKVNFGNTSPPLGRFIHSAFSFNSELILENGLAVDNIAEGTVSWDITTRPSACGFLNGHAFYGDVDNEGKARILVSQLAQSVASLAQCYQDADPTAAEINDLLATDGFVMRPTGMAKPVAFRETSKGLIILASNGVWRISGVAGPFSATNFEISKLGELSFNSPNSVAVVDDVVFFCGDKGIYAVDSNQFGELQLTNLTDSTIRTLYLDYGTDAINRMAAAYIASENYIYWTVPAEQDGFGNNAGSAYDVLVLNLELGGFFKYSFSSEEGRPALHLPLDLSNRVEETVFEPVTINGGTEQVTIPGGELVTIDKLKVTNNRDTLGFVMSYDNGTGEEAFVAVMQDDSFTDWQSLGAPYTYSYSSFIEFATLYPESQVGGIATPYIHSFFEQGRNVVPGTPQTDQEMFRVYQTHILVLEKL